MNRNAMLASGLALLILAGCGGGGGGVRTEADTPSVVLPDPEVVLQGHERLALPAGFAAVEVDTAMFLLANMPTGAVQAGGGGGLSARSLGGGVVPVAAQRPLAYAPDHAVSEDMGGEEVVQIRPEIVTVRGDNYVQLKGGEKVHPGSLSRGYGFVGPGSCDLARGECTLTYPGYPGAVSTGGPIVSPIEDMPFVSDAFREGFSEGVRTRGGVGLRYWSSGNRDVPWLRFHVGRAANSEHLSETWSGYGAWNTWSGFGIVMQAHNHVWDLYDGAWYSAIAGGDKTGDLPEVSGTYRGAAVAMAVDQSIIADGSVEMTVSLGYLRQNPRLDINIGDWQGYRLNDGNEIVPST